jgi:hypothetical protein
MTNMNRRLAIAVALMIFGGGMPMIPAHAAPPTVTPSPGYDARLQEQHAAASAHQPAAPVHPRRVRRHRHDAH